MKFQHMRNFIGECTDTITSEIPAPFNAVQLRAHPSDIIRKRCIHDAPTLTHWFTTSHGRCNVQGGHIPPLSLDQQQTTKAGRAMAIGIVAVYDEMMAAAEKGKFKELRDWIDIVQFLHLVSSQGIKCLSDLKSSPQFSQFNDRLIVDLDIMTVAHQDVEFKKSINLPNTLIEDIIKKIMANIKEYISVNKTALLGLFNERPLDQDQENFEIVKQVIEWVLTPAYNLYVGQAREDIKQLKSGAVSLPEIPRSGTGAVDDFNLIWLVVHEVFEKNHASLRLVQEVHEQKTKEFNELLLGSTEKLRLAELERKEEDAANKLLDMGIEEGLFHAFKPADQKKLLDYALRPTDQVPWDEVFELVAATRREIATSKQ